MYGLQQDIVIPMTIKKLYSKTNLLYNHVCIYLATLHWLTVQSCMYLVIDNAILHTLAAWWCPCLNRDAGTNHASILRFLYWTLHDSVFGRRVFLLSSCLRSRLWQTLLGHSDERPQDTLGRGTRTRGGRTHSAGVLRWEAAGQAQLVMDWSDTSRCL